MDYYNTLGINREASLDDIKRAYRKLASQHHPDKGGDTNKFQEIQQAYEILSDADKRYAYDRSPGSLNGLADFLSRFTRNTNTKTERVYSVTFVVTLEQISVGANESVAIQTPTGPRVVHIRVPKGLENGHTYRYDNAMNDGHLNITFNIAKHDRFERVGLDLFSSEKINVFDLILGTTIEVKTIYDKTLEIEIPPMTKLSTKFRLPEQGLHTDDKKGDHIVLLHPVIPEAVSPRLTEELLKEKVYNLYRKAEN